MCVCMCVCVYIYIYIPVYTTMVLWACIRTQQCFCTYMHTYIFCPCIHVAVPARTRMHAHTHILKKALFKNRFTYIKMKIGYEHTHILIYVNTYAQICAQLFCKFSFKTRRPRLQSLVNFIFVFNSTVNFFTRIPC